MTVRVLLFGVLRDLLGAAEILLEVEEGATTGSLLQQVEALAGARDAGIWGSAAIAVNEQYAARDRVLAAGDVVALLPPVSGG